MNKCDARTIKGTPCMSSASFQVHSNANFDTKNTCQRHLHITCNAFIRQYTPYTVFKKTKNGNLELFNGMIKGLHVQQPVIQQPVIQQPVIQQPVIQQPVIQQPVIDVSKLQPVLEHGKHPCCICYDDTDDVFCTSNRHVLCTTCFVSHVNAELERPEFDGKITCPLHRMNECDCKGFSVSFLAKTVPEDIFNEYDRKRFACKEKTLIDQLKDDFEKKLQFEQSQSVIEKERKYISENILTLTCPNCKQAYFDFDGCMVLRCFNCKKDFCGKCHFICKIGQAHAHVASCGATVQEKGYWKNSTQVKMFQNRLRKKALDKYLATKPNKVEIMKSIKQDLIDLGM